MRIPTQGPGDCGPASLTWAAHRLGKKLHYSSVRLECGADAEGCTALGLVRAASKFGLTATGLRMSKENPQQIGELPTPWIAHGILKTGMAHFITVEKVTKRKIRVYDPERNRREKWTFNRFNEFFSGVALVVGIDPCHNGALANNANKGVLQQLWSVLRPQAQHFIQLVLIALVVAVLALGTSIYVQLMIDRVIPDSDRRLLTILGLAMIVLLLARLILVALQGKLSIQFAQRIDAMLITGYYRHLLKLPQRFFDSMKVGDLMARVGDAGHVRAFLHGSVTEMVIQPIFLLAALTALFFYSWHLAMLSIALLPIHLILFGIINHLNGIQQREVIEAGAAYEAKLAESLHGNRLTRVQGEDGKLARRTENMFVRLLRAARSSAHTQWGTGMANLAIGQAYLLALLWVGALLTLSHDLTAGQLMSCYTLSGFISGPIAHLIGINAQAREALIAAERLFQIMDLEQESEGGPLELKPESVGDIELDGLIFRYPGRLPVINNLNLRFPKGAIIALSGPSGGGKSTVLALLQTLYTPEAGSIRMGGHDLRHFSKKSLRECIYCAPQEVELFAGSLLENLTPFAQEADPQRLLFLCEVLGLRPLIESSPGGLGMKIQERGSNLSGGQRQRIAIVRAITSGAPVLLLDEPTAALDKETEQSLILLLKHQQAGGQTLIIATHSPALIDAADVVYSIGAGNPFEHLPQATG